MEQDPVRRRRLPFSPVPGWAGLLAVLILGSSLALSLLLAKTTGITFDEPSYLGLSWVYWRGDPGPSASEWGPVLSYLRGAALLSAGAKAPMPPAGITKGGINPHDYGQFFLMYNAVPAERLLFWGRAAGAVLLVLLLAAAGWWAASAAGVPAALFALGFASMDPNILAHASLATTDAGFSAFFIAAMALWAWSRGGGPSWAGLAAGAFAGLALGTKATGAMIPAVFGVMEAASWAIRRRVDRDGARALLQAWVVCVAVALISFAPTGLGGFTGMLAFRARQLSSPAPAFLLGKVWPEGHPLYFPLVLAIKTTIPLLVLGLWGLADRRLWKGREAHRWTALSAGGLLMLAALSTRRQLGVRYILPLYPLLSLAAGMAAAALWRSGGKGRILAVGALAWHAVSLLISLPYPLTYVNEAFGGPDEAYRVVGDSNLDWGQGLPELKGFVDANPGGLILSYFGMDCPARLGMSWQDAFCTAERCPGGSVLPVDAGREWLAVSATHLQGIYDRGRPGWAWLASRKPAAVVARTIFVYDVARDPDAHERLAAMYESRGRMAEAGREKARSRLLRAPAGLSRSYWDPRRPAVGRSPGP